MIADTAKPAFKPAKKAAGPKPPARLGADGRTLWRRVVGLFKLEDFHLDVLAAACEQADRAAQARAELAKAGSMIIQNRFKEDKLHPCVEAERVARLAMSKLLRELGLDTALAEESKRGYARRGAT